MLVPEDISGSGLARLGEIARVRIAPELWREPAHLRDGVGGIDALIVRNQTRVDRRLIDRAPHLRVVGRVGVGLDNIDLDACRERGIPVIHGAGLNAVSVAEMTILLMLGLSRRMARASRAARSGSWDRLSSMGHEVQGKVLGLIGFGATAREVAARAKAFGMTVVAHDPLVSEAGDLAELRPLEDLLGVSDVVSIHVPLTPGTRHLLDGDAFARMPPGARVVNTSRGGVVDERALLDALERGHLGGAALDVREQEPPPPDDPLADRDDVLLTPHVAGLTHEAHERVLDHVCQGVADHLRQTERQGTQEEVS